jgi:hypothetical protein
MKHADRVTNHVAHGQLDQLTGRRCRIINPRPDLRIVYRDGRVPMTAPGATAGAARLRR